MSYSELNNELERTLIGGESAVKDVLRCFGSKTDTLSSLAKKFKERKEAFVWSLLKSAGDTFIYMSIDEEKLEGSSQKGYVILIKVANEVIQIPLKLRYNKWLSRPFEYQSLLFSYIKTERGLFLEEVEEVESNLSHGGGLAILCLKNFSDKELRNIEVDAYRLFTVEKEI